jgi:hypothetical protein
MLHQGLVQSGQALRPWLGHRSCYAHWG